MADLLLHPALPLFLAAPVAWWAPRRVGGIVMIAAALVALLQVAQLRAGTVVAVTYAGFDLEVLRVDRLALPFAWVFAIAAAIGAIYGLRTMQARERTAVLAYAGAAMGVVLAGDLMTLFIAWEVKAVASTFVVLERRGGNSARAGMRYLFVHLVGGKLLLAGILWHLADTGSLAFTSLALTPATTLILVAFLLAAAVPPLHAWLADAYPEASVAGTVFLSAFTTKAAVYALARGFPGTRLLIALGVVMALYGVVYAVLENDTRRLLGYHIVSQVGYMVAAVGIGTEAALNGATAHAFAHILYKGLLLMGVGAALHATGRSKMSEMGGIANRMRGVLALYMIGAVSISSVPLFSGFVSKELVVDAAYQSELGWVVLLLKLASVGTFLHTGLKLPYGAWFGREGWGPRRNDGHRIVVGAVPTSMYVAMAISAFLNTAIGIVPGLLYDLLPYPVDYTPYALGKVVEKSQILVFTALAFWLLLDRLGAKAKVSVDTDWLYRRLPVLAADAWRRRPGGRLVPRPAPALHGATLASHGSALASRGSALASRGRALARAFQPTADGTAAPVVPTWVLGGVILAASVLVLIVSLTP